MTIEILTGDRIMPPNFTDPAFTTAIISEQEVVYTPVGRSVLETVRGVQTDIASGRRQLAAQYSEFCRGCDVADRTEAATADQERADADAALERAKQLHAEKMASIAKRQQRGVTSRVDLRASAHELFDAGGAALEELARRGGQIQDALHVVDEWHEKIQHAVDKNEQTRASHILRQSELEAERSGVIEEKDAETAKRDAAQKEKEQTARQNSAVRQQIFREQDSIQHATPKTADEINAQLTDYEVSQDSFTNDNRLTLERILGLAQRIGNANEVINGCEANIRRLDNLIQGHIDGAVACEQTAGQLQDSFVLLEQQRAKLLKRGQALQKVVEQWELILRDGGLDGLDSSSSIVQEFLRKSKELERAQGIESGKPRMSVSLQELEHNPAALPEWGDSAVPSFHLVHKGLGPEIPDDIEVLLPPIPEVSEAKFLQEPPTEEPVGLGSHDWAADVTRRIDTMAPGLGADTFDVGAALQKVLDSRGYGARHT